MAIKKILVWDCTCDVCGYKWLEKDDLPDKCPSAKCRRKQWNMVDEKDVHKVNKNHSQSEQPIPPAPKVTSWMPKQVLVEVFNPETGTLGKFNTKTQQFEG